MTIKKPRKPPAKSKPVAVKAEPRRKVGRPFAPGQSGNPKGTATGSRHKTTLALERMIGDEAVVITRKVINLAKKGDRVCLRLVFERLVPLRRGSPVSFKAPPIGNVRDAVAALGAVIVGLSDGSLTPTEAAEVASVIEVYRKLVDTEEKDARLAALEAEINGGVRHDA